MSECCEWGKRSGLPKEKFGCNQLLLKEKALSWKRNLKGAVFVCFSFFFFGGFVCEGLPSEVSLVESVQEFIPLLLLRCETTGPILGSVLKAAINKR